MNNMGGLHKLYLLIAIDYLGLQISENGLYDVFVRSEDAVTEIPFSDQDAKLSQVGEDTDQGTVYNFEISCRIPRCQPSLPGTDESIYKKKLLVIAEDNNGNFWLAGAPGTHFSILFNDNTGNAPADLNQKQLKIGAALMSECVSINFPVIVDIPEGSGEDDYM